MDDAALDKLIADIQEFLRDSEQSDAAVESLATEATPQTVVPARRLTTRAMQRTARVARAMELVAYVWAVCIIGVLAGLLWFQRPLDAQASLQIFAVATFGVFTTLALVGGGQRLLTLLRIERNTREILRLRRKQNALLARLVDRQS